MAITVTVLNQKKVPGVGLFTTGRMNYSGSYPAGGESNAGLTAALAGHTTIDSVSFLTNNDFMGQYDDSNKKVRIFRNIGGVPTEMTAGAYPAPSSIGFFAISR
jgi:hypothetical protein